MTFRPGARLSGRPLHFVFVLDTSGSMGIDGKIEALNGAIAGALPHVADIADQNPFVEVLVRAICFSDGSRWHLEAPTPVHDVVWADAVAGGSTDLGSALHEVSVVLQSPPMEARAFAPVIVLISDGRPTDDYQAGLRALLAQPWGRRAVRVAIAIGRDADLEVLQEFIDNDDLRPFTANDPEQLAYLIKFVSTVASRLASAPAPEAADAFSLLQGPLASEHSDALLAW